MAQQRFNNLFLLFVHTERTESLDFKSVARDFMSVNSRQLNYLVVLYLSSQISCLLSDELINYIITITMCHLHYFMWIDT